MNEGNDIIGYRVIKHRRTGEIITLPSPVYAGDWPYRDIPENQPLLRYMDFWKFEDLCKTRSLYFRRADKFDDPLEGTISVEGVHGTSPSDLAFKDRVQIAPIPYATLAAYREIVKGVTFVNCWHINNNDSKRMWEMYTKSSDSLLIVSSGGLIRAALKRTVMMSAVKYIDEATPRTEFDERSVFFYKDSSFAFEQEYRLLVDLSTLDVDSIDRDNPDDFFKRIAVDTATLIYMIQPHPQASRETFDKIASLVREHLPHLVSAEHR